MLRLRKIRALFVLASLTVCAFPARAQCLEWVGGFGTKGLTNAASGATAHAMVTFDDGSGPALYVAGSFSLAGGASAPNVARWNGSSWSAVGSLGSGGSNGVYALTVFDDGSGPALYAGGNFTTAGGQPVSRVAKWDGSAWTPLGSGVNSTVWAFATFDDGSGPALYVAGEFLTAGGVPAKRIARWNGASWSAVGTGFNQHVWGLETFDDGSGPALYAGGLFTTADGLPANRIARWNGASWSAMGSGADNFVTAFAVFDEGAGPALYIGGVFSHVDGIAANKIARWDGTSWSALGAGFDDFTVESIVPFDDGSGPALYAGGSFTLAEGLPAQSIASWNGTSWNALGTGLNGGFPRTFALAVYDDGSGSAPALFAAGSFDDAGGVQANNFARWGGASWDAEWTPTGGLNSTVRALAAHDDGAGVALYVGGDFNSAGGVSANGIAKWDGSGWSALDLGLTPGNVQALASFDDGSGAALYAGGSFLNAGGAAANHIARWSGGSWSALGSGVDGIVRALVVFDDGSGSALYAGGTFGQAGGASANRVARWDGTSWSALDTGFDLDVYALGVFDDGSGAALYAGGEFTLASGVEASGIARWDGAQWQPVGGGVFGDSKFGYTVHALASHDDGSGPALYVAGDFLGVGRLTVRDLARWDGTSWSVVGGEPSSNVLALTVFDDGTGGGPALYAGGFFPHMGTTSTSRIAKWSAGNWSALGAGVSSIVYALAPCQLGFGEAPDLFAGGMFTQAGTHGSQKIARWRGCSEQGVTLCFGDGSSGACPCDNIGFRGHGCDNSQGTGGARLSAQGWASLTHDSVVLTSSDELPNAMSTFIQGNTQIARTPFGDGLRCIGGSLKRLGTQPASGGVVSAPLPGATPISLRSAAAGDVLQAGSTRYYQVSYRDPDMSFCAVAAGSSYNISSALQLVWLP